MSPNLFFILLPIMAIICISIPNRIVNTAKCTSHWIAIMTILAGIAGILNKVDIAFSIMFVLLIVLAILHIHKVIKQHNQIEIK